MGKRKTGILKVEGTQRLKKEFLKRFPAAKTMLVCRTPGRAVLFGEDLITAGMPLISTAAGHPVFLAYAASKKAGVAASHLGGLSPADAGIDAEWSAALRAALEPHTRPKTPQGISVMMTVDARPSASLAFPFAAKAGCALAFLDAAQTPLEDTLSRLECAQLLAGFEPNGENGRSPALNYAAILSAEQGCLSKVDPVPLRAESVLLPEDCAVLIGTLDNAAKKGMNRIQVAGLCGLISALVERQLRDDFGEEIELERLGDLWYGPLCLTYDEAEDFCQRAIGRPRTTLAEAAVRLRCEPDAIVERWLHGVELPKQGLPLQAMLSYLCGEYRRAEMARDALLNGDAAECARLMEVSNEERERAFGAGPEALSDALAAALDAGALGGRIEGFGGEFTLSILLHKNGLGAMLSGLAENAGKAAAIHWFEGAAEGAGYLR